MFLGTIVITGMNFTVPKLNKIGFQVVTTLQKDGLESSNLILGVDFTKSNERTGDFLFLNDVIELYGS